MAGSKAGGSNVRFSWPSIPAASRPFAGEEGPNKSKSSAATTRERCLPSDRHPM